MIKSIKAILAQDKEKFKVPRKVQDLIPIKNIWPDGIFKVGNKFSKSFRFSDINYLVASREDKESMFLTYSELLNSLDSGATTKITINNHRLNRSDFEESILMPMKQDGLDEYRKEYTICSWTRQQEQTASHRKSILPSLWRRKTSRKHGHILRESERI